MVGPCQASQFVFSSAKLRTALQSRLQAVRIATISLFDMAWTTLPPVDMEPDVRGPFKKKMAQNRTPIAFALIHDCLLDSPAQVMANLPVG